MGVAKSFERSTDTGVVSVKADEARWELGTFQGLHDDQQQCGEILPKFVVEAAAGSGREVRAHHW
jgi:hypothetical protein